MPVRQPHDAPPPPGWPATTTTYLTKPRLSPLFPPQLLPFLFDLSALSELSAVKFAPRACAHPNAVVIKIIQDKVHPAYGQCGLFARQKIPPDTLVIPYLGVIHASFVLDPSHAPNQPEAPVAALPANDERLDSDYDLSLVSISSADPRNPYRGYHISIGVDAAQAGNAGRMVNDFRGVGQAPNAEFRLGKGETGELRMEIWSTKKGKGIAKGEELLVSYGKGWWGARKS